MVLPVPSDRRRVVAAALPDGQERRARDGRHRSGRRLAGPGCNHALRRRGPFKRGQTAWLSGAADPRVVGIVSVASDVLNSPAQIAHHREGAGEISASSSIFDEVIQAADTPRGRSLIAMVDPYSYRDRLTEPKLIVLGTNDDRPRLW